MVMIIKILILKL